MTYLKGPKVTFYFRVFSFLFRKALTQKIKISLFLLLFLRSGQICTTIASIKNQLYFDLFQDLHTPLQKTSEVFLLLLQFYRMLANFLQFQN